ncbi:hypothetical protein D0Y65_010041 [Glycine soja]|uniref:DUF659 domain-containing protein n=1 Tax=Glycine soja TaxID=3848 RepID=A0A445L1G3_GLYSO|nr:hypothetical protein D0Y65_010041 [Glycine soja]RZC17008.1 hypothetical protein D0Y65_010041 [Glycine soja]RZC17009.1 hypothetical protein D0Y65_010041 [Glycine soja]
MMKTPPVQDYIGNGDLPPDKEFDPGIFNTYSEYTPKQAYFQPMIDALYNMSPGYKAPTYCINLMLQDMGKLVESILAQKDALRVMVTSKEWASSAYAKEAKAKKFVEQVLDSGFWSKCVDVVKLTEPLAVSGIGVYLSTFIKKKRNRLEHKKLNDLVYVRYNLRKKGQQCYDPINLETLDDLVDWIMEDSPPFLTNEEVDALRKDLANMTIQSLSNDIGPLNLDDDVDEAQGNPMENMNLNESNIDHEVTMGDSFEFFNEEGVPKNDNDLIYVP